MRLSGNKRACFVCKQVSSQDGFVLILTMVMLAILSILGIMVLNTTDTELSITTNYRTNTDAFIGAEVGVAYAKQKVVLDREPISQTVNYPLTSAGAAGEIIDDVGNALPGILPDGLVLDVNGRNEIDFYTGSAPAKMISHTSTDAYQKNIYRTSDSVGVEGDAAYYRVSVEANARGRSSARVEALFINRGGQVF